MPPTVITRPLEAMPAREQPLPSPSPTPAQALASDYLPFEDILLRYYDPVSGRTIESAIEFFSEETGLVQRHFTGGEESSIEVSEYDNGAIVRRYTLAGIGYFQNFTPLFEPGERETLIAEPIAVGTKWVIPGGIREITALNKRVSFPNNFGEFSVLEVTTNYANKSVMVQQYMKNVGLVAETLTDPDGNFVRRMQVIEREKGHTITKVVRFYYVYPEAGELRYIDREITLRTNIDLKAKFGDEWRNVPPGSGLIPLSPDVRIIRMNPHGDSIIVDFTNEIVANMRLGPQGERLLLQAVTNTLCDYYKLNRVYPYVGGVAYKLQSTALNSDYLTPTADALEYNPS